MKHYEEKSIAEICEATGSTKGRSSPTSSARPASCASAWRTLDENRRRASPDPDEIVDRVFPATTVRRPSPPTSARAPPARRRWARLREAWLLDRGAVEGVVDALPVAYWDAQRASVLARLEAGNEGGREGAPPWRPAATTRRFRFRDRRGALPPPPGLAAGSLAAALVLVVGSRSAG